ncbi:MAG: hypothetical protein ACKUBY_00660 [Candidatus Moraniibacteriota bacterium]|jgi:hypothetical protein
MEKKDLKIIKEKLETEWPGESVYFFDSKDNPNNDGHRTIELWSRRHASLSSELFRCIICELNHSHSTCPECGMTATQDE